MGVQRMDRAPALSRTDSRRRRCDETREAADPRDVHRRISSTSSNGRCARRGRNASASWPRRGRRRRSGRAPTSSQKMREMIPPEKRPRRIIEELSAARVLRAVYSERQLNEVMVDFWMNHFNVYAAKGLDRVFVTSFERDVDAAARSGGGSRTCCSPPRSRPRCSSTSTTRSRRPTKTTARSRRCGRAAARSVRESRRGRAAARRRARRPERELRPRADGAAHARRGRRLHAEGRHRARPRPDGLVDRPPRQESRAASSSGRLCTTSATKTVLGTRLPGRAAAWKRASG